MNCVTELSMFQGFINGLLTIVIVILMRENHELKKLIKRR